MDDDFIVLGDRQGRGLGVTTTQPVRFYRNDRRRHLYVIGQTGTGKSTLAENMIRQDIAKGEGVTFIDPNGDQALRLLDRIPPHRAKDVLLFDPAGELDWPVGFNIVASQATVKLSALAVSAATEVFTTYWELTKINSRLVGLLRNSLSALVEAPNATLYDMKRLLIDDAYRDRLIHRHVSNYDVKTYWFEEVNGWTKSYRQDGFAALLTRLDAFFMDGMMKNIFAQNRNAIDMRKLMDDRRIVILRLSKGGMGVENARLVGSLFVTLTVLAAYSREGIPEHDRIDHYLYVDEFQNLATPTFADACSEARKYRLNLVLLHQFIAQLPDAIKTAIFGNVQSIMVFAVGGDDAEEMERQFGREIVASQFIHIEPHHALARFRSLDAGQPFRVRTHSPLGKIYGRGRLILQESRMAHATPREKIERHLRLHERRIVPPDSMALKEAMKRLNADRRGR